MRGEAGSDSESAARRTRVSDRTDGLSEGDAFRLAFEQSPLAMAQLTLGGEIVRANGRLVRLLGYADERELVARRLADLVAGEAPAASRGLPADVTHAEWSAPLVRRDHSTVDVHVTLWQVRETGTQLIAALVASAEDDAGHSMTASGVEHPDLPVLDDIADVVLAVDRASVVTYANGRAAALTGRERAALMGQPLTDVLPSSLGGRVAGAVTRALADGSPARFELTSASLGLALAVTAYPTVGGVVVLCQDMSGRTSTEQALQASERRYRSLVASSSQVVWTADARGRVEDIPSWRELTGQTLGEVSGWGWLDAIHPADRERTRQIFADAFASGTRCETLYRVRSRDGAYRYFFHRAVAIKDEDGVVREWVGMCADINERKQADEWRAFLADASRMLGSSLDVETTISSIARLAITSLADYCIVYTVDDAGAVRAHDAVHRDPLRAERLRYMVSRFPPDVARDRHPVVQAMRTGTTIHVPIVTDEMLREIARTEEHLKLLRELAAVSGLNIPLVARGRTIGALALRRAVPGRYFTDTDVGYAEELASRAAQALDNALLYQQASQARREAEAARAEAEKLRSDAEGANLAKSEFLAVMSHELRTPLNAIGGYADLLEMGVRGELTEVQREDLRRIKRSGTHLLGLINEILNFARIEAGRVQLDFKNVNVAEALMAAEALVSPQARSRGLTIVREKVDPRLDAHGDRERVQQVVLNLLTNAVKFTDAGGRITLSGLHEGDRVGLRVTDTGRGIPAEKHEAIFEPFVQVDRRLAREQEGVGLGLAISRELARAMDGNLTVESVVGVGSTFTLWLPAAALAKRSMAGD